MKKKSKTIQGTALRATHHAEFQENNEHLYLLLSKTSSKKSNGTQNCVLKLDVAIKILSDFFSISLLGLGFGLKKGWEMGLRLPPFRTFFLVLRSSRYTLYCRTKGGKKGRIKT